MLSFFMRSTWGTGDASMCITTIEGSDEHFLSTFSDLLKAVLPRPARSRVNFDRDSRLAQLERHAAPLIERLLRDRLRVAM